MVGSSPVTRIAMAALIVSIVGALGAPRAWPRPAEHVADCGAVTVEIDETSFDTAFDIVFRIETTEKICTPDPRYLSFVQGARSLEMRVPGDVGPPVESLRAPLRFRKMRPGKARPPSLGASAFRSLPHKTFEKIGTGVGAAINWIVPPGDYVLVFRYAPSPCNKRFFADTCVASSVPFRIAKPTRYLGR